LARKLFLLSSKKDFNIIILERQHKAKNYEGV
jgi:hypothetical protein